MGLIERLRKAEEQGLSAAQRKLEKAREAWDDSERRLRRKMRLHPRAEHPPATLPDEIQPPTSSDKQVADVTLSHRASEEDAA